jgi:hypothetical protein
MQTLRLPMTYGVEFRNDTTDKGSKMVNCYPDDYNGTLYAKKRPGYVSSGIDFGTGTAQGVYTYANKIYAVLNNTLYNTDLTTTTTVGTIIGTTDPCYFTNTLNNGYLFFHKGDYGYTYNGTTLAKLNNDDVAFITVTTGGTGYLNPFLWIESSPVSQYQTIYFGTNVYLITVAGTLGTTAPTFTSGTAANGTATLAYIGTTTSIIPSVVFSDPPGVIALGTITPGSGYVDGTYNNVQLTYVSGPTATSYPQANITISGGQVVLVTLIPGGGILSSTGTVLSANSVDIGGTGTGFSIPVTKRGITATGTAVVTGGTLNTITITNPGVGYTSSPSVTIGTAWAPSTAYTIGQQISAGANLYTVVVAGTTSTSAPTHITGAVANGTATLLWAGIPATVTCLLNGFPSGNLVPGTAYFDTYVFVMTEDGKIWNSEPNDPTKWDALNYVTAEAEPDKGVALAKHFNYLMAFGQWSTEFFYDAGNAVGSPLLPNQTFRIEFGCANGNSVVEMQQTVVWVAVGRNTGRTVLMLDGTRPVQISDVSIERILNQSSLQNVRSYSLKISGHYFYVLNLLDDDLTLVCDIKSKQWSIWTSFVNGQETILDGVFYTSYNNEGYALDNDNGVLYNVSEHNYTDLVGPIQYRIRTPLIDADSTMRKFIGRLEVVGDKIGATLRIRHTDDDYQNWSQYRNVNLNDTRSVLYQNGNFRRRAYEFFCTDNQPIRLQACEMDLDAGTN